MSDTFLQAHDEATGTAIAARLRVADSHWSRMKGLLGTSELPAGEGLWITPCRQVHMLGMRYPIDVAFLDDARRVVHTIANLRPGRISPNVRAAASVVELPAGTLERTALRPGATLAITGNHVPSPGARARGAVPAAPLRAVGAVLCNVVLAAFYLFFATAHLDIARRTGAWVTTMPIVVVETMFVVLALTRRRSAATSASAIDWAIGIVGMVLPLCVRPTDTPSPLLWIGQPLQIAGLVLAALALAFLGRSIGVVAAHRGVKTMGPYAWVRHPVYGAYTVSYVGYLAVHPTCRNAFFLALAVVALRTRALIEERFLAHDPLYRAYQQQITWRFVPYVY